MSAQIWVQPDQMSNSMAKVYKAYSNYLKCQTTQNIGESKKKRIEGKTEKLAKR